MYLPKSLLNKLNFLAIAAVLAAYFLIPNAQVWAQDDPTTMAKETNKELRDSKRMMFSRKFEESKTHLDKAAKLIQKIKTADPAFQQLKGLESKYAKQKKDLEKRLPKTNTPGTTTTPKKTSPAGKSSSDELPAAIKRRLAGIDRSLQNFDRYFNSITAESEQVEVDEAGKQLNAAKKEMDQLLKYYGDKIAPGHPELKSRKARIASSEKKYTDFESSYKGAKEKAAQGKAAQLKEAQAIGEKMNALYSRHSSKFEGIYGATMVYDFNIEKAKKELKKIEMIEKDVLPVAQPVLKSIVEKYGDSAMTVNNNLHKLGMPSHEQFGNDFDRLYESVNNVSKSRKATAASIASRSKNQLSSIDSLGADYRVKRLQDTKAMLQIGHKFDPGNGGINQMLSAIDEKIHAVAGKIEKDIDSKNWKGHIKNFAGPGDPKMLAKTALQYFKNSKQWGKNPKVKVEILKVSVRGQWKMAETNILGQVIQWRLPIHLAITNQKLKSKGIARVYELSILSVEGAPGKVKKAPPFDGYWVGNNWMIRLKKLPK